MAHDGSSRLGDFALFSEDGDGDVLPFGTKETTSLNLLTASDDQDGPARKGGVQIGLNDGSGGGLAGPGSADSGLAAFDTSYLSEMAATESLSTGTATWVVPHQISIAANIGLDPAESGVAEGLGAPPGAPGPAGSLQTLADYLRVGFWSDFSGASPRWFNMTSSGSGANSGTLYYNVTGWVGNLATVYGNEADSNGITAARADMVRAAFALYSAVLGINFVETTSTATHVDFFFKDSAAGTAYEAEQLVSGTGGAMDYSVINVAAAWSGSSSNIGGTNGYTFQTFLHEIGHALGLGHQGLYNAGSGSPTYANSAQWANDSWMQTMMSYWDQSENTEYSTDSYAQLVSPMAVDWIALNALYSGQGYGTSNAFTGNTVWGVGTNISAATSAAFNGLAGFAATNAFTIVDGGGIDTIDFSNYSANQTINLTPSSASNTHATLSSVGGLTYNMTLAVGTIIENATTGSGNDTIYGNDANNVLTGNTGSDYLSSYGGNDVLYGGGGTDTMYGGDGNDSIYGGFTTNGDFAYGGDGNDFIQSGLGTETMNGGNDTDIIDHRNFDGDYVFDMGTGATNYGGESYLNFEIAYMGDGNDSVTGRNAASDTIYGGLGNDTINAGASTAGDVVYGGDGNDSILSGFGNESMYGGNGTDVIDHRIYDLDYTFNMATGQTQFIFELYQGFEVVYMGDGNDSVTGATGAESIYGGLGNDTINDGSGNDAVYGGDGNDLLNAGDSSFAGDSWDGGIGTDTLSYEAYNWGTPGSPVVFNFLTGEASYNGFTETFTSIEIFRGSQGDETIISNGGGQTYYGNDGNDSMVSGFGNEVMYGGNGTDVIDHRIYDLDYTFNMATGQTQFIFELYQGFEVVYMGDGNDSVTGATGAESIYGGLGNDTINDGSGNDAVYGGDGNDLLNAGDSSFAGDSWDGGIGTDTLSYEAYNWGTPGSPVVFSFLTGEASYNGFTETFTSIEVFRGSQGDETIISNGGGQTYYGNDGNDSMVSGLGGETMYGGNGIDVIDHRAYDGDYVFDMTTGLTNSGNELYQGFEAAYMGDGNDSVTGTTGAESIYGGLGNDTINASLGGTGDFVDGGSGNDSIVSGLGAETLDGGADSDVLDHTAYTGNAVFDMATGLTNVLGQSYVNFETVLMGKGDDSVTGGVGNDEIHGGKGNDSLFGGSGVDALHGEGGADYFEYVTGAGYDDIDGGNGVDTVVFQAFFGDPLTIDLLAGTFNAGGPTYDFIAIEKVTTSTGNDSVTGSGHGNRITLGDGNDTASGGGNQDVIFGDAGSDSLLGDSGNDSIRGGTEGDLLNGGSGDDTLGGDDGDDTLIGANGNDSLVGGTGNDSISGGGDNDTLLGGTGNDTLAGDNGADLFVFAGNYGLDVINGFVTIGVTDVIDLSGVAAISDFADLVAHHLADVAGNAVITSGANSITLTGILSANLLADDFVF